MRLKSATERFLISLAYPQIDFILSYNNLVFYGRLLSVVVVITGDDRVVRVPKCAYFRFP
jgi:hypothetical protein